MMDHELKKEIDELLNMTEGDVFTKLIAWLYHHRQESTLEELTAYIDKAWCDRKRHQMANEFHFKRSREFSPAFSLIQELEIFGKSETWGGNYLRLLGATPYAVNLRILFIVSCDLKRGTLRTLFSSEYLHQLHHVRIKSTFLTDKETFFLAESSVIRQLSQLEIIAQDLNDQWLQTYLNHNPKVTHLNFAGNQLSDASMNRLMKSSVWTDLQFLNVERNRISSSMSDELQKNSETKSGLVIVC